MNPEDLLTDALHDRVERTDYPSTPLATVAGRAGALRARRRRTTALAAAAAIAVVAVPGSLWLGHSPATSPTPTGPSSSGPTTDPSTDPTAPTVAAINLDALPQGAKPGIDYLVGATYVTMNGDRITAPAFGKAATATPVRGGILIAMPNRVPGGIDLVLHTDQGDQQLGCGSGRFAMSTDGTESAYWVANACTGKFTGQLYSGANNTMGESGPSGVKTYSTGVVEPVGIVRQGTIVNGLLGSPPHPQVVDPAGNASSLATLAYAAGSDENNDVVSGQLATATTTGAVVDVSTGVVKWRAPGWQLGQFSDDGKYVVGFRQETDSATWTVFDAATGGKVSTLHGVDAEVSQVAWDQDGTLLMVVTNGSSEAVVRLDLKGHVTLALPERALQAAGMAYRLATRP